MGRAAVRTALAELEARFGPMEPLGTGHEARVFRGGPWVYKVYRPRERELAALEARNLARVGFGERVHEVVTLESGHGVLVLRYFPGRPLSPELLDDRALASLAGFLHRLHRLPEPGSLDAAPLLERVERFAAELAGIAETEPVFAAVRRRLELVAGARHVFGHGDLWAGNVLIADDGRVFVVDWGRAGALDPARDLAILKTGSLDLLGPARALATLAVIVRQYPDPEGVWSRLSFWIPLTYLHDLYWFKTKAPQGLAQALSEKLPPAIELSRRFPDLWEV